MPLKDLKKHSKNSLGSECTGEGEAEERKKTEEEKSKKRSELCCPLLSPRHDLVRTPGVVFLPLGEKKSSRVYVHTHTYTDLAFRVYVHRAPRVHRERDEVKSVTQVRRDKISAERCVRDAQTVSLPSLLFPETLRHSVNLESLLPPSLSVC